MLDESGVVGDFPPEESATCVQNEPVDTQRGTAVAREEREIGGFSVMEQADDVLVVRGDEWKLGYDRTILESREIRSSDRTVRIEVLENRRNRVRREIEELREGSLPLPGKELPPVLEKRGVGFGRPADS